MSEVSAASPLQIKIEDKLSLPETALFGAQHLLGLTGIFIFPGIIGAVLGLSPQDTGYIAQMCFITTGIVTILQSSVILKLPIVQGPTAVFFSAILSTGATLGLGVAYGSMFVAALIFLLLAIPFGNLGLIGHLRAYIAPPIVFGSLMLIVGVQLATIGLPGWFGSAGASGFPVVNFLIAVFTIAVTLGCMVFGGNSLWKRGAFLWGIIAGSLVALIAGLFDLAPVAAAGWVSLPKIFPFGFGVNAGVVLAMCIAFFHATAEAAGMYTLITTWDPQELSVNRVNRGIFSEVAGCALGAAFGGLATNSYPENVGIIRVTGIASRYVTLMAGVLALALGFLPKVGTLIAVIPGPILSAASTVLFGVILVSGLQQLARVQWDELNIAVVAVPYMVAIGTLFFPSAVLDLIPVSIHNLFTQPILAVLILVMIFNVVINMIIRPRLKPAKPLTVKAVSSED